MRNGEVRLKRIGSQLPIGVRPADWIERGQMIIACGKVIRRQMIANMFCTADGRQFLKVDECEPAAEPDDSLFPGVYFKLSEGARIKGLGGPCLKAGIHDICRFINICRRKDVKEKDESGWEKRKQILRAISDLHQWFVPGVYEIDLEMTARLIQADLERQTAETVSLRASDSGCANGDRHLLRRTDFAGGGITLAESEKLKVFLDKWSQKAQRTAPINKTDLTSAIEHLYHSFNLKKPKIVIAASPLEMIVAGLREVALSHVRQFGTSATNQSLPILDGLVASEIFEATVHTAFRSIDDMLDCETAREFDHLIDQNRGAFTRQNWYGASGYVAESALQEIADIVARADGNGYDRIAALLSSTDEMTRKLMLACLHNGGRFLEIWNAQRYDECLTSALQEVLGLRFTVDDKLVAWQCVATNCSAMLMHEEFCIVSDFPEMVNFDDEGRPHSGVGPSARWRDGWTLYHWHGTKVQGRFIEAPETIRIADIRAEQNLEVRRVLIEFYGIKRFLLDSDARQIHRDECGVLYSLEIDPRLEPIVMVKVKNSTAEPDGSFKDYFLMVPPYIATAKAAVAWTFGISAEEYGPIVQT